MGAVLNSLEPNEISLVASVEPAAAVPPIQYVPRIVLPGGKGPPGKYRGSAFGLMWVFQLCVQLATWAAAGLAHLRGIRNAKRGPEGPPLACRARGLLPD